MSDHKTGCPATGGYGHGKEACICGSSSPLDLTPIRAAVESPYPMYTRQDVITLLAEVDRLRAENALKLADQEAAYQQLAAAEARLAAIQALKEKWRKENGDYPESKQDCAADLDAALAGQGREPSQK